MQRINARVRRHKCIYKEVGVSADIQRESQVRETAETRWRNCIV